MENTKHAVLLWTPCGTGESPLTAAIRVLSASGTEVCAAPADAKKLMSYTEQWKKKGYTFDVLAFGVPQTKKQAGALSSVLNAFRKKDQLFLFGSCVWGGHPKKNGLTQDKARLTQPFCAQADVVILPIADTVVLMGERGHDGQWNRQTVEDLLRGVCSLGAKNTVATGICFSPELPGAAGYSSENGSVSYAFSHRIDTNASGAGSLFCAAFLTSLLHGINQGPALQLAVDFMAGCIRRTREHGGSIDCEWDCESCLPKLRSWLGLPKESNVL